MKTARRNINNLIYADVTILMAENEELKSLLMKVKEKIKKVGLKLKIQKTNIMGAITICSDFGDRPSKNLTPFQLFPLLFLMK